MNGKRMKYIAWAIGLLLILASIVIVVENYDNDDRHIWKYACGSAVFMAIVSIVLFYFGRSIEKEMDHIDSFKINDE